MEIARNARAKPGLEVRITGEITCESSKELAT
jgi:hypothetical protein